MDDAAQKSDYEDLYNYLKKKGENTAKRPLQTHGSESQEKNNL